MTITTLMIPRKVKVYFINEQNNYFRLSSLEKDNMSGECAEQVDLRGYSL